MIPLVVPVRFSGGGLAMQTTSSRLAEDGIFVRCMVSPKEGSALQLEITFPGVARPVAIPATLTERVASGTAGREAGFFAKFGELSRDAAMHLDALLKSRGERGLAPAMKPNAPIDHRASDRLRTRIQVGWASPKEFLVAYSENISRGGIFVSTKVPPPLRSVVELMLELPDGLPPVKTQAEVVHRVEPGQGRVAGAGLQFVGGDDEFRRRLDACIEQLLRSP